MVGEILWDLTRLGGVLSDVFAGHKYHHVLMGRCGLYEN